MVASYFGHETVVKLLLEAKADIESKSSILARTSLSYAAEKGHEDVVKLLHSTTTTSSHS
jgi:ankyrin repeat protein